MISKSLDVCLVSDIVHQMRSKAHNIHGIITCMLCVGKSLFLGHIIYVMKKVLLFLSILLIVNYSFGQLPTADDVLAYTYPGPSGGQYYFDHYDGKGNVVDMQTFRYVEYLGKSEQGEHIVQVREFSQLDGGNIKGAITVNRYEIGNSGVYITRREIQKSMVGNKGVTNYSDGGPYYFKMPLKNVKQTWAFSENGERTVFTSEFVILKIEGRSYRAIRITEKHYNSKGALLIAPINKYYVKGVGLWMVTLGKEEKLHIKLRDAETFLVDGENGEIQQKEDPKASPGQQKNNGPKAIMPRRTERTK